MIRNAYAESIGEEPRRFESFSKGVHLWLQAQNLDSKEALEKLKTHPGETITKVALRQMSRLGRAMQDTVEVQLERQEVAIHSHLHRAPNAVKAEARHMRVWCRKCRLDVTKRIEYSSRYEVATGKYIAWPHVCRQCCSVISKNKYPQQHFNNGRS